MVTRLYIERVPGVRAFETLPLSECLTDKLGHPWMSVFIPTLRVPLT